METMLEESQEYELVSRSGSHSIRDYCYLFKECPRPGKFDSEKAIRLGIPEGPLWHKLQSGKAISIGEMLVEPSIILGASRAGRIIGFSGDTRPKRFFNKFFEKADLLVFEATYSEKDFEKAVQNMHSTATEAAKIASKANVKMLALVHLSSRYIDADVILAEASRYHKNVIIPEDLTAVEIPYPESNEPLKVHRLSSS
jgi:ribonuclease Z